jgi:hypothetical protein
MVGKCTPYLLPFAAPPKPNPKKLTTSEALQASHHDTINDRISWDAMDEHDPREDLALPHYRWLLAVWATVMGCLPIPILL